MAEVFVSGQVAVEGMGHEVVGERKMFRDRLDRPLVEVQVQQALVTAVETANLPSELEQLRERLQTWSAACVSTDMHQRNYSSNRVWIGGFSCVVESSFESERLEL